MMGGMMGGKGGDGGGMMGGGFGMGGGGDVGNFWKSEEKRVMIRALDFTVEPDNTYRYRVRIVVFNPNLQPRRRQPGRGHQGREGADRSLERADRRGDHAGRRVRLCDGVLPPNPKSDIKVDFQVIRFDPEDGVTVPHKFDAQPGEVIGEVRTADIPVLGRHGQEDGPLDFNTREIVLDADGGLQAMPPG